MGLGTYTWVERANFEIPQYRDGRCEDRSRFTQINDIVSWNSERKTKYKQNKRYTLIFCHKKQLNDAFFTTSVSFAMTVGRHLGWIAISNWNRGRSFPFYSASSCLTVTKCNNVHYTWTSFSLEMKTSRIYSIRVASSGETSIKRTQFSADDWRARGETVRLQLSSYKQFKFDRSNWIPTWHATITQQIGAPRTNHERAFCYRYDYIWYTVQKCTSKIVPSNSSDNQHLTA